MAANFPRVIKDQPTDPRSLANFKQDKYTENQTKAHHSNNAENKDKILERWWGKGSNDSMTASFFTLHCKAVTDQL